MARVSISTSQLAPTAWLLGVAIVAFAGIAVYVHKTWEEVVSIILGICLFVSPWVVGFADLRASVLDGALKNGSVAEGPGLVYDKSA